MRRLRFLSLLLLVLACSISFLSPKPVAAACPPLASDKGQSSGTITVPAAGQYTLWVRMLAPASGSDSVYVQIDDQCPVTVNDSKISTSGFLWVNFKDGQPTQPITLNLTAGNHAIVLAGREVGAGVDKVLLTSDPSCVPIDMGDNCLQGSSSTATTGQGGQGAKTTVQPGAAQPHKANWWVVGVCALVVAAAGVFIVRLYRSFVKSFAAIAQQSGAIVGNDFYEHATLWRRLLHFVRHHTLMVAAWAVVTVVAVTVGIVAAASTQPVFEAETGKLSGGATTADNAAASGGKYVWFQNNPIAPGGGQTGGAGGGGTGGGGKSGGGSAGGGSNGGGGTGGGGQNGGGGGTASSCALPKFPNTSCTGVPSGTSYKRTVSGVYYATTPGEVIDSWHIAGDLVIQTTNVTIKNSLIDGHVDNDSLPSVTSFTISDSTVGPAICDTQGWPSLNAHDFTATRVFLRGHQDGIDVVGDNATVSDSLVQPCYQPPEVVGSDGFHSDGVQDQCGGICGHFTFTHNTFDSRAFYNGQMTGNSAIYLGSPYNGTGNNAYGVTLQNNLFMGGGYTTALWWNNVGGGANWIISGNAWAQGTWAYGPDDSVNTCSHQSWSGNTIVTVDANFAVTSTVGASNCID